VALSNHIGVDNGMERIMYSDARMDYMPNIYIIGQDGFCNFCQVFRTLSYEMLEKV
jgi:metallo-beta-lactamase class B